MRQEMWQKYAGRSKAFCGLGSMDRQNSGYPGSCAHPARQPQSWGHSHTYTPTLFTTHSLCRHCGQRLTWSHVQAATPRHEGQSPLSQVASFYMSVAKQSSLANTVCVYFINCSPGKIMQIPQGPLGKQTLDSLEKAFSFEIKWLLKGVHDPQHYRLDSQEHFSHREKQDSHDGEKGCPKLGSGKML